MPAAARVRRAENGFGGAVVKGADRARTRFGSSRRLGFDGAIADAPTPRQVIGTLLLGYVRPRRLPRVPLK